MEARFITTHSVPRQARPRRWRRLFAALISAALVLSFFHGLSFDSEDGAPMISIAQGSGDTSGKAPAHPAPLHGDHCLTHLSSMASQETSIAIEFVAHGYRIVSLRSPDGACPRSPFEPPRA
jgi:hypothetical protein